MTENLTDPIKSSKCRHLIRNPYCTSFDNQRYKLKFDVLATFHDISYLSVVSYRRSKCEFFSRKQPQKIGGIVISDKSGLTKDMSQ